MPQIGGDIEELQALVSTFQQQAEAVTQLKATIDSKLGATWWIGPAKEKFQSAWETQFKPSLNNLTEALNEAGTEVNNRANALQQAGS